MLNRYTVEVVIVTDADPCQWIEDALANNLYGGEELYGVNVTNILPQEDNGE